MAYGLNGSWSCGECRNLQVNVLCYDTRGKEALNALEIRRLHRWEHVIEVGKDVLLGLWTLDLP